MQCPHVEYGADDFDNLDECPRLRGLHVGAKELVRFFKNSGLMQHLKTALKQEVSTHWNTTFYLSVLSNFNEVQHILKTRDEIYRMALVHCSRFLARFCVLSFIQKF